MPYAMHCKYMSGSEQHVTYNITLFIFLPFFFFRSATQIGTNNCTARYRTLSGGIGESPSLSPSPSSDYEDDNATKHLPNLVKNKRNGPHMGAIISQKATVHHVSIFIEELSRQR